MEESNNPYKRLPQNEKEEYQRQLQEKVAQQSHGHYTDEHIDAVTKDFCHWVVGLGGAKDNIDEETVGDLFAIGHESKPTISVPLNVIQIIEVPRDVLGNIGKEVTPETKGKKVRRKNKTQQQQRQLRPEVTLTRELLGRFQNRKQERCPERSISEGKKIWNFAGPQRPSSDTFVRYKYGAWYLKPDTWKKLPPGEYLKSPDSKHIRTMNEARSMSSKFDEELAPMHVTKSFMKYVKQKQVRKPAFFDHLEEIQKRLKREEEQRELEARQHKQRLLSRLYQAPRRIRPVMPPTSSGEKTAVN